MVHLITRYDIGSINSVDDAFLQQAASSIPKKAIFLIEDIDCAFGSRDECDNISGGAGLGSGYMSPPGLGQGSRRSSVTLSGLLNVIDGIGSEEGVLFFATVSRRLSGCFVKLNRLSLISCVDQPYRPP